ncbi:MAG: J domain-containing protein [Sedimentisphaerales bacterium]|nr:J domain-containing protein [Sedimentisphaerales bacterium]
MKEDPEFMERISRDINARKAACKILQVEENAGKKELKKAYRRAAIQYHPDHSGNTTEANRKFTLVRCAYELLAYDKPCERILAEIDSWPGVPADNEYRLDNPWGHFLWWRDKFFDSNQKNDKKRKKGKSCI